MNNTVGNYAAGDEYWRFDTAGTAQLASADELQLSGTAYTNSQNPLSGFYPPSGSGYASNDAVVPTDVTYGSLSHQATRVYQMTHAQNFLVRVVISISITNGTASGTMTFYHDNPGYGGYLFAPGTNYTLTAVSNPSWSDPDWREYHYQ
jgi:hypothetical protein